MKKIIVSLLLSLSCLFTISTNVQAEDTKNLSQKLEGQILLQIEKNGEAWYVYPNDLKRYYLDSPKDAWNIMRTMGTGISNENLNKIPVGIIYEMIDQDTDKDGLSDNIEKILHTDINNYDTDQDGHWDSVEIENNYDPLNANNYKLPIDTNFSNKLKGRILLQVESHGEAWYINPRDGKRYYMGRPDDAFRIMKYLGLGITNQNLAKIANNTDLKFNSDSNTVTINLNGNNSGTYGIMTQNWSGGISCSLEVNRNKLTSTISNKGSVKIAAYSLLEFHNPLVKPHKTYLDLTFKDKLSTINFYAQNADYHELPDYYNGSCNLEKAGYSKIVLSDAENQLSKKDIELNDNKLKIDITPLLQSKDSNNTQLAVKVLEKYIEKNVELKDAKLILEYN